MPFYTLIKICYSLVKVCGIILSSPLIIILMKKQKIAKKVKDKSYTIYLIENEKDEEFFIKTTTELTG